MPLGIQQWLDPQWWIVTSSPTARGAWLQLLLLRGCVSTRGSATTAGGVVGMVSVTTGGSAVGARSVEEAAYANTGRSAVNARSV